MAHTYTAEVCCFLHIGVRVHPNPAYYLCSKRLFWCILSVLLTPTERKPIHLVLFGFYFRYTATSSRRI